MLFIDSPAQRLLYFFCAAAKKVAKKAALWRTAPHAKVAKLRVILVWPPHRHG